MNKKALAALVGTLAFGTATVTAFAGEAAPAKDAPAPKDAKTKTTKETKKKDGKENSCSGGKEGSCSGGKKETK